jgi:hypothetical protein
MIRLNAVQLRAAADYASSLRTVGGDSLYVTAEMQENTGFMVLGNAPAPKGSTAPGNTVAEVDTSDVTPNREPLTFAEIQVAAGKVNLLGKYDAVFWSEAAVEKFVIPYYASKSLWMAGYVLTVLSEKWYGQVPGEAQQRDPMAEIPFALAHLPSSDYVTLQSPDEPVSGGAIGADLILLAVDSSTGQITETPLSFYL